MEPPPLPRNQDCHELWSKRRKRQLKEQQQNVGPLHNMPEQQQQQQQPIPPQQQPMSYAQHRELLQRQQQQPSYNDKGEDGRASLMYDSMDPAENNAMMMAGGGGPTIGGGGDGSLGGGDDSGGVGGVSHLQAPLEGALSRLHYSGDNGGGGGGTGMNSLSNSPHSNPVGGSGGPVSPRSTGGLSRAVGYVANLINNRQPVNYGHVSALSKEQVSVILPSK